MEELKMLKKLIEDNLLIRQDIVDILSKEKKENSINYKDVYMYNIGIVDGYIHVLEDIKDMLDSDEE